MAFNGSGVFNRLYNWVTDAAGGIKILASRMDAEMDGMATGLSTCLTKDGQTNPTANLPMAGYRHTGVGNATVRTDYIAAGQVMDNAIQYNTDTGSANAYAISPTPAFFAYVEGMRVAFKAVNANTTASTLSVSGLATKALKGPFGNALVANAITAGQLVEAIYNGTDFIICNANGGSAFTHQGSVNYVTAAGTDTYTASLGLTAYVSGAEYRVKFTNGNTIAGPTLNLDSLGAKTIKSASGGSLSPGDIPSGSETTLRYDGTDLIALAISVRTITEPVRQTVITGSTDANGQANFLSSGTGLAVSRAATTTPVIVTAAAGEDEIGPINYRKRFAADQADYWSGLPANNLSFLFDDRDTSTGTWTAYKTLVPPQYGAAFDKTKQALLHLDNAITDDYGNAWVNTNGTFVASPVKIGTHSWQGNGTTAYFGSTAITSVGDDFDISAWFYINALPTSGNRACLVNWTNAGGWGIVLSLYNNAGTTRLELSLSSNGSSADIVSGIVGTNTTWTLSQWNRLRIVYDPVAVAYKVFLSLNGAAESTDITQASDARICALTINRFGANHTPANFANVNFDEIRFSPCCRNTTTETPSAAAFTPDAEWFSLSDYTWRYGSPTAWTVKQRVAVGEATTTGAGIASVTTYALRGEYVSPIYGLAASTQYSNNHNLGVVPRESRTRIVFITTEIGYAPGDEADLDTVQHSSTSSVGITTSVTRRSVSAVTAAYIAAVNKATGVPTLITTASAKLRSYIRRGW